MKRFLKTFLLFVLAGSMVFGLAACGGKEQTLETFFEKHTEEKKEFLDALVDDNEQLSCQGEVTENTIRVTCKFKETYDKELLDLVVPGLEETEKNAKAEIEPLKKQIADETKIDVEKITVELIYLNGDGTEFYRITI